jgi:hypothetical protein
MVGIATYLLIGVLSAKSTWMAASALQAVFRWDSSQLNAPISNISAIAVVTRANMYE